LLWSTHHFVCNFLQVIKLALDIANGLAYLHMRGVVHADLSANNILLCRVKPSADPTTSLTGKVPGGSSSNSKSQGAVLKAQGIVEPRQTSHNSHETSAGSGAKGSPPGCGAELTAAAAACATPSVNSINTTVAVTPPATRFMIAPAMPRAADDMEFTGKVCEQLQSCMVEVVELASDAPQETGCMDNTLVCL
jgi:serine/threonine protein kinase